MPTQLQQSVQADPVEPVQAHNPDPTEGGLTEAQQRTLDAIREYIHTNGIPPSVRDVGDLMGLSSTSSVQIHLMNLARAGAIEVRKGVPRSIRVLWPCPEAC